MGHFIVGACYPNEKLTTELASFDIYGLKRTSNSYITCETLVGEPYNGSITLSNPGELPLTGVKVEVLSALEHCKVITHLQPEIAGGNNATLSYTLTNDAVTSGNDWEEIKLRVTTSEGVSMDITLYHFCRSPKGKLQASVSTINTTMIKGASRDYSFTIVNQGKGATGKISLALPDVAWMKAVTPIEMASLNYGETATVVLRLTPTEDMQLNVPMTGRIGINCENGDGIPLNYRIEPVSESTGTLTIDVCDEYTYYTAEAPHVAGAQVLVKHPVTGAIVAQGITGADGTYSVELPEGYYTVSVTADKHDSYQNNVLVDPGVEADLTVNLSFQAITVDWTVEETEVEDKYEIVTTVKYETNVPMPVVLLNIPKSIDGDNMGIGETKIVYFTATNVGLLTALNTTINIPEDSQEWTFEALEDVGPFDLAPQQTIVIPVAITRQQVSNAPVTKRSTNIAEYFNDCMAVASAEYEAMCGEEMKHNESIERMAMKMCGLAATGAVMFDALSSILSRVPAIKLSTPNVPAPNVSKGKPIDSKVEKNNPGTGKSVSMCDPCEAKKAEELVEVLIGFTWLGVINDKLNDTYDLAKESVGKTDEQQKRVMTMTAYKKLVEKLKNDTPYKIDEKWGTGYAEKIMTGAELIGTIYRLTKECPEDNGPSETRTSSITRSSNNSVKNVFNIVGRDLIDYLCCYEDILQEYFGDSIWYNDENVEEKAEFFDYLINNEDAPMDEILSRKPTDVTDEQVRNLLDRIANYVTNTSSENTINMDALIPFFEQSRELNDKAIDSGYESLINQFHIAYEDLVEHYSESSSSVCASITLQFSQTMTMTRQAFRGTLTVFNGHETTAMEDVKLSLEVRDEYGALATAHEFQINAESLDKFGGELSLDAGWSLAANETGVATILFIPTKYAAPTEEKKYSFGGTLSYIDPFTGLEVTRDLYPVTLTVKPSPNLEMTYFMQRDIFGDDPLTTDVVEPMEPSEFSLLINNVGYGDATNVRMVTEQPKIIENEKGLFIDFELLSSQLNGGEQTLALGGSVPTEFGTIPAHSTAYAQWWIQSTLLGHFTEYDIEATHVTSYGNEDLSLLDTVTIHELVRSIKVPAKEDKVLTGFLVNDITDAEDMPDMLYLSDGIVESVSVTTEATISKNSDTEYLLTVTPMQAGWNYGSLVDPTYGKQDIVRIVRQSDGAEINLRNIWQTDRTLRDGKDPLYESRIHFVDKFGTTEESYLITFEPKPDKVLEVEKFMGVPANDVVVKEALKEVTVCFNKPIDAATFTTEDLTLNCQGKAQDVTQIVITQVSNTEYKLDISALSAFNGYYVLTVQTAGIVDNEGFAGEAGKTASWVQYVGGKVNLMIQVTPDNAGTVTPAAGLYDYEEKLTLTATANEGYEFLNWSSNGEVIATTPTCEYLMEGDATLTATFALKNYNVEIVCNRNEGVVTGAGTGVYPYGNVLSLTAEPLSGYVFDGWYIVDSKIAEASTYVHTVDSAVQIEARFTQVIYDLTLRLEDGWNWISAYFADEELMTSWEFLTPIKNSVERFVGMETEIVNDPEYGLTGNLHTLSPTEGYKVKTNRLMLNTWTGVKANTDSTQIALKKGWNWIGYPAAIAMEVNEAFANAEPDNEDYIVGQDGFAQYTDGEWIGTLKTLEPGKGYMYHSESEKEFAYNTAIYAKAQHMYRSSAVEETPWNADKHKYPNIMCMIAELFVDETIIDMENCIIGAFCGDECRGIGRYVNGRMMMNVYGEKNEDITFLVMDNDSERIFDVVENVPFTETLLGTVNQPYPLHISGGTGILNVQGNWRVQVEDGNLYLSLNSKMFDRVALTDVYGNTVLAIEDVASGEPINISTLLSGVYIITAEQDGAIYYKKIMKFGK